MQSSVEKLEGLAHKLVIEVPADRVDQAVETRLKEIRPRVRIDGFRPGKVPPHVIKQKYGAGVRQEVLENVISQSLAEAFDANQLQPVAPPQVNILSGFAADEALKYEALFEVNPEVEVKGLDSLEITLPKSDISDKDIDAMIDILLRQQATYTESSDAAADDGDRVRVDFVGKLNGEAFEGGSGEDVPVVIGGGQMLPDFEAGLKGAKVGEEKTFDVAFPTEYPTADLAGQTAQFTATIKKVEKMNLPALDETFIKNFGIDAGDEDSFRKAIRENMVRELDNALRRIKRDRLFDALLAANSEQLIAESAVDQEIGRMSRELNLEKQIPDAEQRAKLAKQIFDEPARRRVRLGLLLGKLFSEKNIELDQSRVDARLNSIASTYEDPAEVREWYGRDRNAKISLESAILEEQLIDTIYENAKVSEEEKTFQEVMALNAQIRN
ncbi:MAG: trigger factor [Cardiobacteriaceae bacterium]|nr:trigger factor [Cardiobacteriaceae bacterium]